MSGNLSKSAFFKGGGSLSVNISEGRGHLPPTAKTRVIAISCGIKLFALHHLVLSQYMHMTDGRTDGQTELQEQYCELHYMQSHGKMTVFQMHIFIDRNL